MDDLLEFVVTFALCALIIGVVVNAFHDDYNDKFIRFNMRCIENGGHIISLDNSWVCQK